MFYYTWKTARDILTVSGWLGFPHGAFVASVLLRSSTSLLSENQLPGCTCLETWRLVWLLDPRPTKLCIIIYPYVLDSHEPPPASGNKVFKEPAVAGVVPTAPRAAALAFRFSSLSLDDCFL